MICKELYCSHWYCVTGRGYKVNLVPRKRSWNSCVHSVWDYSAWAIARDLILMFLFLCSGLISRSCLWTDILKTYAIHGKWLQSKYWCKKYIKMSSSILKNFGRSLLITATFFEMHQKNKMDWWIDRWIGIW